MILNSNGFILMAIHMNKVNLDWQTVLEAMNGGPYEINMFGILVDLEPVCLGAIHPREVVATNGNPSMSYVENGVDTLQLGVVRVDDACLPSSLDYAQDSLF
jgi:hypothetical protein